MSNEQFRHNIERIEQHIAAQTEKDKAAWQEIAAAIERLQLIHEEMQTSLEVAEVLQEGLLQQNQGIAADYQHYYQLFHTSPIAYVVTDANGLILEANQAIAQRLNVPQRYLMGKPLAVFVAEDERPVFRHQLNQLSQLRDVQIWQTRLCPRGGEPWVAELNAAIVCNDSGWIESLQIGVYDVSRYHRYQPTVAQSTQHRFPGSVQDRGVSLTSLPRSLDGLQVLVVDDEADAREFITAVLESHGVCVTAVATTAAALEALERFHPDVLVSDVRMPDEDGYSLIRKVRQLEAQQGWHLPAAAITAYLEEDREKALTAGFEAHLHKLAQPNELIEMVAQLAGQRMA